MQRLVDGRALEAEKARRGVTSAEAQGVPLGRWLIDAGWIAADRWAEEAARTLNLEYRRTLEADAASGVGRWPADFFARHRAAALRIREGVLTIAVADPTDQENLEAIEAFVRMPLEVVCAAESVIRSHGSAVPPASKKDEVVSPEIVRLDEPQADAHLRFLHEVIRGAIARGATDVHLLVDAAGVHARVRVDGLLGAVLWDDGPGIAGPALNRLKVLSGVDLTESRIPQDGSFTVSAQGRSIDVRASILPARGGASVVLRILDRERLAAGGEKLTLQRLGVLAPEADAILRAVRRPHGLVVIVGPTGSGKSTTLYATLEEAHDPTRKLVTIEDPVEYRLGAAVQVEVDDRSGLGFATGLRSILRHDPDRILVGEIRDVETAQIALQAALTGHLVMTTLHATGAVEVSERFAALGVDRTSLSGPLSLLVSQRLVRKVCAACEGKGCETCERSGFRGRVVLMEVSAKGAADAPLVAVRPIGEVARAMLDARSTTRLEIERVWPEALS